ncbi:MAG: hypothetical protein ABUS79_25480, partial [Pseudomonadota bacterium]
RALLWEEGEEVVIRLEASDGTLMGMRRLPRTFGCEDLASAVAVSLAGWESDVHPEFAPRLSARALPSATPIGVAIVNSSAPAQPWRINAGVALGLGGSVDGAAAGDATIGAWLRPPAWTAALRAEIEGQSERQRAVQGGQAAWRRWTLGLGIERPFVASSDGGVAWLRWFALARLAWLDVRGQGLSPNRRDTAPDPGAAAGVRARTTGVGWSLWAEIAMAAWPVRHELMVAGANDTRLLPAVEGFARIGVSTPER